MGKNQSRHCEKIVMSKEDLLARLATAAYKGCDRDLKNLLKAGALIDGFTMHGKSALQQAARSGQYSCVRILLEHNACANISSYDRRTPLMEAAEHGYMDCLIMLLKYGADPNKVSTDQMTALHYAARNGHKDCLERLLQNGSNVDAVGSGGWRPLHFAARHGHSMCVKQLLHYGAQVDPPTSTAASARVSSYMYVVYVHPFKFILFKVCSYSPYKKGLGRRCFGLKKKIVVNVVIEISFRLLFPRWSHSWHAFVRTVYKHF